MDRAPCLVIRKNVVKQDTALQPGGRGARKFLVTTLFSNEEHSTACEWKPPTESENCAVRVMVDTEAAVFTQGTPQDRHYHQKGTETYVVLEGAMTIEVEGVSYPLSAGDTITVFPNAAHEVKREGMEFLCLIFTANCGGKDDKFLADKTAEPSTAADPVAM